MIGVARTAGWSLGSALVAVLFAVRGADATLACLEAATVFAGLGVVLSASRPAAHRG